MIDLSKQPLQFLDEPGEVGDRSKKRNLVQILPNALPNGHLLQNPILFIGNKTLF